MLIAWPAIVTAGLLSFGLKLTVALASPPIAGRRGCRDADAVLSYVVSIRALRVWPPRWPVTSAASSLWAWPDRLAIAGCCHSALAPRRQLGITTVGPLLWLAPLSNVHRSSLRMRGRRAKSSRR